MRKIEILIALAASVLIMAATAAHAAPEVTGIKAYLFYAPSGTLSENIIDNDKFFLFNTIIGAGEAEEPSSQTMVVVELGGKCLVGACKLTFTATEQYEKKSKVILQKTTEAFCETEKCNIAFMLYDVGCQPVELAAKLDGSKKVVKKRIEFACGE